MMCFQSQTLWTVTFDPDPGNQNCLSLRDAWLKIILWLLQKHTTGQKGGGGTKDIEQNQRQSLHINNQHV